MNILICLFALILSFPVFAADYYMAPNGSDANNGSITAPWKNLSTASGRLRPGDTLYARGGTYLAQYGVWASPSGTSTAPIRWKAYPGEIPIFDGQGKAADFLQVWGTDWLIFEGITIQKYNGNAAIWMGSDDAADLATNNVIRNMRIYDMGATSLDHGIYLSLNVKNVEVSGNVILRSSGAGIHGYHEPAVDGAKVFNNVIADSGGWGIVFRSAKNLQIYNNTIINCHEDLDIVLSTNANIYNNILSMPILGLTATTIADYNMFTKGTPNGGSHSFVGSPDFVDVGSSNFRLRSSSQAINRGTAVSVSTDADGLSRPQQGAFDIGAYEFPAPAPVPSPMPAPSPLVKLNGTQFAPGASITVSVSGGGTSVSEYVALYLASNPDSAFSFQGNWIFLNGTQVQPSVPVSSAILTFKAPMDPGVYNIRFFGGSDATSLLAVSSNINVVAPLPPTADVTAPTTAIISPLNGTSVRRGSTVTVNATAADNVAVNKVEFYVNGTLKCTDTFAPYSCTFGVARRRGVQYSIQSRAYDAAGNVGRSTVISIQTGR